jgi:formyltetrahydrofolate deformylase
VAERIESFAPDLHAEWRVRSADRKMKVLLLVSKLDRCLGDLIYRIRVDELNMEPVGIISNHPWEAMSASLFSGTPLHYLPITRATKPAQEQ